MNGSPTDEIINSSIEYSDDNDLSIDILHRSLVTSGFYKNDQQHSLSKQSSKFSSALTIKTVLRYQKRKSQPWKYTGSLIFYYLIIPFLTNLILPFRAQYKIFKGRKEVKKKILVIDAINRWLVFIDTLCTDVMLVLMSLAAKGKYVEFLKQYHLYYSLNQIHEGFQATFRAGSKFFASLVLFQSLSMLSDCIDNLNGLMRLYITFKDFKYALSSIGLGTLVTLNMFAFAAVITDIALSIYVLIKNNSTLLGVIPGLTIAIHLFNIAIDVIQTCFFIAKLNTILTEVQKDIVNATNDDEYDNFSATNDGSSNNKKQKLAQSKNLYYGLLHTINKQAYALIFRTVAKLILCTILITAISVNPIVGTLLTFGALAIKQAFKQESSNSQYAATYTTCSLGGKYGIGMPSCLYSYLSKQKGADITDNGESSISHNYSRSIT